MELAKLKAIQSKLTPDSFSVWRKIEREYSKTFFTPLHEVSKLDPEIILLNLYEDQLGSFDLDEDKDLQSILDNLYTIENPEYDANREKEEEEYNRQAVKEEEERQAKIKAKKNTSHKNAPEVKKELPKSGYVNLAYLADNAEKEG